MNRLKDRVSREVAREGYGLHTGSPSRVTLRRSPGPVTFQVRGPLIELCRAEVVGTDRATTLEVLGRRVASVEHLFAALGGLGVRRGVSIEVEGPEVPLLDGAARVWCEAILGLGLAGGDAPELEVVRPGDFRVDDSLYSFAPSDGVGVEVTIDFHDPRFAPSASWDGDRSDFLERIAVARTFASAEDVEDRAERGSVARVSPESVVILAPYGVLFAGPPFLPDEPARHKLLDLVGDLYVYGGAPRGKVRAHRPGHTATHEVVREALARGVLRRVVSSAADAPTGL
jgi:UDP-3-O-[3-hydroxymyristoyl] N-acetylglucosamine deacetylase